MTHIRVRPSASEEPIDPITPLNCEWPAPCFRTDCAVSARRPGNGSERALNRVAVGDRRHRAVDQARPLRRKTQ